MSSRTFIRWHEPWSGEPGALLAEHGGEEVEVETIREALAWAAERGPQVTVIVGGEVFDAVPDGAAQERLDAAIAHDRERFARETATYDEPVQWFLAVLEPDSDEPGALAASIGAEPEVVSARIHRRQGRRGAETWLVVRVAARSHDEASRTALEVVLRHVWPDARMDAELPEGPFVITAGRAGYEAVGLAAYEDETLRQAAARAAATASSSQRSLRSTPAWPLTLTQLTSWRSSWTSSASHSSRLATGVLAAVFQPRFCQPAIHRLVIACMT